MIQYVDVFLTALVQETGCFLYVPGLALGFLETFG
jgi:hypothetical protein